MDIEKLLAQIKNAANPISMIGNAVGHVDLLDQNAEALLKLAAESQRKMDAREPGWDKPFVQALHATLMAIVPVIKAAQAAWPTIAAAEKDLLPPQGAATGMQGPHGPGCICPPEGDFIEADVEDGDLPTQ